MSVNATVYNQYFLFEGSVYNHFTPAHQLYSPRISMLTSIALKQASRQIDFINSSYQN